MFKLKMRKFKLFDKLLHEDGFSIVMVVVALAVVASGTSYIIGLNKKSKVQSAVSRSTTFIEQERKRISTFLGDSDVCTSIFQGRSSNGTHTTLTISGVTTFLTTASTVNQYNKGTLTLSGITTIFIAGNANSGHLRLVYGDTTATNILRSASSGKKNTIIDIPMYMKVDGANNILQCYAITENQRVATAIAASCITAPTNSLVYTTTSSTVMETCTNNINHASSTLTDCTGTAGTALNGFDISAVSGGYSMAIPATRCTGFSSAGTDTCPLDQKAYGVSAGVIQCNYPGNAHDPTQCASGDVFNRTSGTTGSCITISCSGYSFVNTISASVGGGFSCATTTPASCAAGKYIRGFNASGAPICDPIPNMNGDCTGTPGFGVSITRNSGTYDGVLNCSAYNKAKPCGGPTSTFLNNLTGAGSAVCTTY